MEKILAIAAAGALGTLARYGLAGVVQRVFGASFPWGTAAVNLTGCFVFGVIFAAAQERAWIGPELRTLLLVGFLGAFTTFSTFVAESGQLLAERELLLGAGNIVLQVAAGLVVFFLGLSLGRAI